MPGRGTENSVVRIVGEVSKNQPRPQPSECLEIGALQQFTLEPMDATFMTFHGMLRGFAQGSFHRLPAPPDKPLLLGQAADYSMIAKT